MAIVVRSLLEERGSAVFARVSHAGREFAALVDGSLSTVTAELGRSMIVEMSFDRVASWCLLPGFDDDDSGITAVEDAPEALVIRGRVHSVIPVDADTTVLDVYLRAGPEFLTLNSNEIGGSSPVIGSGIELIVEGLCFYPTRT